MLNYEYLQQYSVCEKILSTKINLNNNGHTLSKKIRKKDRSTSTDKSLVVVKKDINTVLENETIDNDMDENEVIEAEVSEHMSKMNISGAYCLC
jgi:hypothetical protein